MPPKLISDAHQRKVRWMLAETLTIFLSLGAALIATELFAQQLGPMRWPLTLLLTIAQGGWLHRLYTAAHEAIHRKLIPQHKLLNDTIGQALLAPLLIPLPIYRKIHNFHHTHNRRDHHTSTLDGYVVSSPPSLLRRAWIQLCWYLGVFAGGYFLHGVVSILLFLFVPPSLAPRISPAFDRWQWSDQLRSAAIFASCVGLHIGLATLLTPQLWWAALGRPFLFFAWIYSLFVYIYHYRTTYGDETVYNVRSVPAPRFFRWWLLNFNHHRVHHRYPTLPWHLLPEEPAELPPHYAHNENVPHLAAAITQQLQGAEIFVETKP